MVLTLLSLFIFALYLALSIESYGIPPSLSETYYLLGRTPFGFNKLKASIFTFMMWAISFTLLPAMLDLTPDSFKFLMFLALASICFVGAAPNFKDPDEGKVHSTSAILAACFGILWSVLMPFGFIGLGLAIFGVLVGALATDTIKDSRIFWLEMIAFGCVYLTAIFNLL